MFVTGNPELDFFDQNPVLLYKREFKALIEDVGREIASKVMWSIFMVEDPNSQLFRMPRPDRIDEVKLTYYDFDDKQYEDVAKIYAKLAMGKEENLYKIHIEKLDELTSYLQDLKLEDDKQFSKYIRILDKLPKAWDALDKVKTKMLQKQSKSGMRGGASQSSREKRL